MYRSRKIAVIMALLFSFGFAQAADARPTITDIVAKSGGEFDKNRYDYDILLTAVLAADLQGPLGNPDARLTVFAPNDMAFIRLARDLGYPGKDEAGTWAFLVEALTGLGDGDPIPVLTDILLYHVVPDKVNVFGFLRAAIRGNLIPTLLEDGNMDPVTLKPFLFGLVDKEPDLRNPRLTFPINLRASNGIIHTINRVLIPIDLP